MKWLRRTLDFYLDASIHVAVSVLALTLITGLIYNFKIDFHLCSFIFFGTIACYNFIKYGVEAKKYFVMTNRRHKNIQIFSFVVLGLALYHMFFLYLNDFVVLGLIALCTFFYALPILPNAKNLRSLGITKVLLIGVVWALSTVILPLVHHHIILSWDMGVEAFQRFLLVLILLVPFEIRDLQYDPPELRTIPQRIGATNSKSIGAVGAMVFFFLTFLKDEVTAYEAISKGILFLVLGYAMFMTRRNQSKYFASFWIEAIPIFWWVILWLLMKFLPSWGEWA